MTKLDYFWEAPSQTAGPHVHIGLIPHQVGFDTFKKSFSNVLVDPDTYGERIVIEGQVLDEQGAPCPADRQVDKAADPAFRSWGCTCTDFTSGLYWFETVRPGPVVGRRGHKPLPPHVSFWLVARGIKIGLQTRMYFADKPELNNADPVVRRDTLPAQREHCGGVATYVFDMYLQGRPREGLLQCLKAAIHSAPKRPRCPSGKVCEISGASPG